MDHADNAGFAVRKCDVFGVVVAGIAGGLVDAAYFSATALLNGRSPTAVLQSIATFWLGPAARDGGAASAALGLATHFALATIMASGYFFMAKMLSFFRQRPRISGTAYGFFLYGVMYFIVLPLRWPALSPRFEGAKSLLDVAAHIAVGVAIALVISQWLSRRYAEASR